MLTSGPPASREAPASKVIHLGVPTPPAADTMCPGYAKLASTEHVGCTLKCHSLVAQGEGTVAALLWRLEQTLIILGSPR